MEDFLIERPIIFGEALFDLFGSNQRTLGGAPFNVAWHLKGFGLDPFFISAVGEDELGMEILKKMQEWGMDVSGVQKNKNYPTGQVTVKNAEVKPIFDIQDNQAYDVINFEEAKKALEESGDTFSLIYHGTLATRQKISNDTLNKLVSLIDRPVFLDVNMRKPFWNERKTAFFVSDADWVKLNEEELLELTGKENYKREVDLRGLAFDFMDKHDLDFLAVTLGDDGAWFWVGEEVIKPKLLGSWREKGGDFINSVGAGDAFSAVIILGIVLKWENEKILNRALEFAWKVCTIQGTVSEDRNFYIDMLKSWV